MEDSRLLGSSEVAKRLGRDRSTISRWVKSGRLTPAMTVPGYNGDLLFDPADIEAFQEGTS